MQTGIITANRQMLFIEDAPRSHRELHHRHQGMYLAGTHDQLLIELRLVYSQERGELASADHIRTGIGISQQTGSNHIRDQQADRIPRVIFITQTLNQRFTSHLPSGTIFVKREIQPDLRPIPAHIH